MPSAVQTNLDWAPLLEEATREVFAIMLGATIDSEPNACQSTRESAGGEGSKSALLEVIFRRDDEPQPEAMAEVTAVVGLAGELCGVLKLICGTGAARRMAAQMLGIDECGAGDQQWDAIGEMANMIAGNFKAKLPGLGDRCMLSVPTIVVGSNYRLRTVAERRRIEFPFRVASEKVRVTLEMQQ